MKKIAALLILLSSVLFSQQYTTENYIARLIQTHKGVMLGDMSHHQPVFTKNLVKVLYAWLEEASKDSSARGLTLILEMEPKIQELLNDSTTRDNFPQILKYGFDYISTIENAEFYFELVTFINRVNRLNSAGKNFRFKIKGFEDNNYPLSAKTNLESELWFINERDSVLGQKISGYMKENPGENILLFYGGMHLQSRKTDKSIILRDVTSNEGEGFWLAHYLKKQFGENEILTISQIISPAWIIDTIVNFDTSFIGSDYTWFQKQFNYISPLPLSTLFGRRYIQAVIISVRNMENYPEGVRAQNNKANYLNGLYLITGKKFSTSSEAQNWYDTTGYDPFARIRSDEFWHQCYDLFKENPKSIQFRNALRQLGFFPGIMDTSFVPDSVYWFGEYRENVTENILILNSISLLFFAYPEEKSQAENYLNRITGWNHFDPVEYMRWYRIKNFNTDY